MVPAERAWPVSQARRGPEERAAAARADRPVTSGTKTITNSGEGRTYIIDVPANYEMNKPYRVFYASHFLNGMADMVARKNYYRLKTNTAAANIPAIFIAP